MVHKPKINIVWDISFLIWPSLIFPQQGQECPGDRFQTESQTLPIPYISRVSTLTYTLSDYGVKTAEFMESFDVILIIIAKILSDNIFDNHKVQLPYGWLLSS